MSALACRILLDLLVIIAGEGFPECVAAALLLLIRRGCFDWRQMPDHLSHVSD